MFCIKLPYGLCAWFALGFYAEYQTELELFYNIPNYDDVLSVVIGVDFLAYKIRKDIYQEIYIDCLIEATAVANEN